MKNSLKEVVLFCEFLLYFYTILILLQGCIVCSLLRFKGIWKVFSFTGSSLPSYFIKWKRSSRLFSMVLVFNFFLSRVKFNQSSVLSSIVSWVEICKEQRFISVWSWQLFWSCVHECLALDTYRWPSQNVSIQESSTVLTFILFCLFLYIFAAWILCYDDLLIQNNDPGSLIWFCDEDIHVIAQRFYSLKMFPMHTKMGEVDGGATVSVSQIA